MGQELLAAVLSPSHCPQDHEGEPMQANRSITQDPSAHTAGADIPKDLAAPTSFHGALLGVEPAHSVDADVQDDLVRPDPFHSSILGGDAALLGESTAQDYPLPYIGDKPYYRLIRTKAPYAWKTAHGKAIYEIGKRTIDIAGSLTLLVVTFPVLLCVAVLIKVTSPGPIFFRQKRLGRNGKEFWIVKFRTMVINAEELLRDDQELHEQFAANYKIKEDPRIIRYGNFLRNTSLDELPQLWHVLMGDMSLIGPRPIVPPELTKYAIYQKKLLSVKPGLSGLWQACGRSNTTYDERVQMDMHYIDHRCLFLDLQLLLVTAVAVLRKSGAC
jgi:lipopolysaccharide/colanic/teichoic acid biosynthesis glycosyltransferase